MKKNFFEGIFRDRFFAGIKKIERKISLYAIKSGHIWSKIAIGRKKNAIFPNTGLVQRKLQGSVLREASSKKF